MAILSVKCSWMHRPYTVRGSAPKEAEEFIISQFDDRIEIFWHYTNFDHPQAPWHESVTGTEVLPADYFDTHTMADFLRYLEAQPWGRVFVREINRDDRIRRLFAQK